MFKTHQFIIFLQFLIKKDPSFYVHHLFKTHQCTPQYMYPRVYRSVSCITYYNLQDFSDPHGLGEEIPKKIIMIFPRSELFGIFLGTLCHFLETFSTIGAISRLFSSFSCSDDDLSLNDKYQSLDIRRLFLHIVDLIERVKLREMLLFFLFSGSFFVAQFVLSLFVIFRI